MTEQKQASESAGGNIAGMTPVHAVTVLSEAANTLMVGTTSISLVSTSSMLVKLSVFSQREAYV